MSINEDDTKFIYAIKLVQPKDLGSIVYPNTWHYSWKVPAIGMLVIDTCHASTSNWHHSLTKMWHTLIFLKSMVNDHVFMNSVSLSKNSVLGNFESWLDCVYDLN
jgi:hypothetical protein